LTEIDSVGYREGRLRAKGAIANMTKRADLYWRKTSGKEKGELGVREN